MHCYSHPAQLSSASLELCRRKTTAQTQQPRAMGRVSQAALCFMKSGPCASAHPTARWRQLRGLAGASHGTRGHAEGDREQAATEHLPHANGDLARLHKPAIRRHCDRKKEEAARRKMSSPTRCTSQGLARAQAACGQGRAHQPFWSWPGEKSQGSPGGSWGSELRRQHWKNT